MINYLMCLSVQYFNSPGIGGTEILIYQFSQWVPMRMACKDSTDFSGI